MHLIRRATIAVVGVLVLSTIAIAGPRGASTDPSSVPVGSSCSGHLSDFVPPSSVRVWDNMNYVGGGVYERPMLDYVKEVLWREWGSGWSVHSLRAGAMAVLHFGWYRADYYGPRYNGTGQCFDVATSEQRWGWCPVGGCPADTNAAVNDVFAVHRLYRPTGGAARILHAKHLQGDPPPEIDGDRQDYCGELNWAPAPGDTASQYGTKACADGGEVHSAIMRRYYFNGVEPGHVTLLDDAPGVADYNGGLYVFGVNKPGQLLGVAE